MIKYMNRSRWLSKVARCVRNKGKTLQYVGRQGLGGMIQHSAKHKSRLFLAAITLRKFLISIDLEILQELTYGTKM